MPSSSPIDGSRTCPSSGNDTTAYSIRQTGRSVDRLFILLGGSYYPSFQTEFPDCHLHDRIGQLFQTLYTEAGLKPPEDCVDTINEDINPDTYAETPEPDYSDLSRAILQGFATAVETFKGLFKTVLTKDEKCDALHKGIRKMLGSLADAGTKGTVEENWEKVSGRFNHWGLLDEDGNANYGPNVFSYQLVQRVEDPDKDWSKI